MKRIAYSVILALIIAPLLIFAQTRVKTGGAATPVVYGESWAGVDRTGIARPLIGMNASGVSIDPAARSTTFGGNVAITGTLTAAGVSMSGIRVYECGTSAACSPTNVSTSDWSFTGSCALTSAMPSTCSVSALSPAYTSSSTYWCTASPNGTTAAIAAAGVAINRTSGSAFTITGPDSVTTVVTFQCTGH